MKPAPAIKLLFPVLAALQMTGCATRMEGATTQQAAYDFKCSSDQISIEKVAFGEYRAAGCGKSASYQLVGECYFAWNPCRAARIAPVEAKPVTAKDP